MKIDEFSMLFFPLTLPSRHSKHKKSSTDLASAAKRLVARLVSKPSPIVSLLSSLQRE
jgi:hypothetical protein